MSNVDGYLKIKTKLDNSKIDKDITELEDKIKNIQTDNANLSRDQSNLQQEIENYNKLQNKADEYKEKLKQLNKEKKAITVGGLKASNIPKYDMITNEIEQIKMKYAQATAEIDKQVPKLERTYAKLDKIKAKQTENNAKLEKFKNEIDSINVKKVQNNLNNIGKTINSQIGKIGKMALAITGIRTAWQLVKGTIGTVAQYNKQVSADLEYMKFAVAQTFLPVVQKLIDLLYTVLGYVNAIANAWFGINLFGNASVKSFKKMQNSASGTAKSTKEIQKSLSGFDEMNILSNSSTDSGIGGTIAPSVDLSGIQGDVPEWLKWIINNKDLILSIFAGIVSGLLAVKLGLDPIKSLGLGFLIGGIVYTVQSLINYLNDPSWQNFGKVLQGVGIAIIGLGILIGNVPVIIAGAIVLIIGIIIKYWEQIKEFLQNGINWLKEKGDWVRWMFGDLAGDIYDVFVDNLQLVLNWLDTTFNNLKTVFDNIIDFIKNVFTGNWKGAWENIKSIFVTCFNQLKNTFLTFINLIWNNVKMVGSKAGEIAANAFKAVVNTVLGAIDNILNNPIRDINSLSGLINNKFGIDIPKLPTINLPRLAKGGIINQPTQAVIGEAGREAVVPLENNMEWLDILADKLAGKLGNNGGTYIIQMDSRVLQRGIARKKQEFAFATNGR